MVKVIGVVVALFVLAWLGLVGSLAWQARAERKRMRARLARRSTAELREMVMTWAYLVQYETAEPVRDFRELFDRADYAAILRRWRSLSAGLFALDDGPPSQPPRSLTAARTSSCLPLSRCFTSARGEERSQASRRSRASPEFCLKSDQLPLARRWGLGDSSAGNVAGMGVAPGASGSAPGTSRASGTRASSTCVAATGNTGRRKM